MRLCAAANVLILPAQRALILSGPRIAIRDTLAFGFSRYQDLPERVPTDWSPAILMTGGPYAFSRHPMYVGELALWLGWAVLYGSIPVLIGFAVLAAVVGLLAPREERALEAKFGEVYRRYKARVPRWVGLPGRGRAEAEQGVAAT